jgi:nucleotide-binding universal stress UspA family protein
MVHCRPQKLKKLYISRRMNLSFRKIAVAIAFSPRIRSILAESVRLKKIWNAQLVVIHVGEKKEEQHNLLQDHLTAVGIADFSDIKIFWETGKPAHTILARCKKENVDLLITGALKKENIIQYYLGTLARKILRSAHCSVLTLIEPHDPPLPFHNIVVNAPNKPGVIEVISTAVAIARHDSARWLHLVRDIKLYGLTMSASEQYSENEYEDMRQSLVHEEVAAVQALLKHVPHEGLKVNIKLLSGKSGFELASFARRKNADLIVVASPKRRFSFFDRVFPHDLEYLFADLPCNLLIVHTGKEERRG